MSYLYIIEELYNQLNDVEEHGEVATYIRELSHIDSDKFGVCLIDSDNQYHQVGDSDEPFSIQSIAKVLSLTLAYKMAGESLWDRIGVEPSGSPFNSLVQLEYDNGIPRNPFINAGAIVVCDYLISQLDQPEDEFISFVRRVSKNEQINYSEEIAASEKATGYRNAALINLMKDFGNIRNDIGKVLDFYFLLCSIKMSCRELARTFLYLMNYGKDPETGEQVISLSKTKRINAIMQTCGFYDEAGEFSFKVGLPGKSGVGGGIIAVHPKQYSIAVWSPRLNKKGNSWKGMQFLERFTTKTEQSIF